jgi:polyisoprenoid-binding protein YceI
MHRKLWSALALLALLSTGANAAPDKYVFDKDHTHIIFFVSHVGFSDTIGRFNAFDGYFTFDEKEPEKSEVDVTIQSASIDTGVAILDKALKAESFLNVAAFPTMHFKSTEIRNPAYSSAGPENARADVVGDLTLLGVTKPVVLHVKYNKSGIHPFTNNYVSGFSVDTKFKRSDYGMKSYIPDVGNEIRVHIEVEGTDPLRHPGNAKTPH